MSSGLEQSQAVLRAILESPKDIVIFALDRSYRYLAFNENHRRTMRAIWGVEISVGLNMLDVISRDDDRARAKSNFDRVLAGESLTLVEEYGDDRINRRYYEDVYSPILGEDGSVIGLTLYLTDITEQRKVEQELERHREHLEELVEQRTAELEAAHAQLLHAQKLESLGVLAGGVAHDFNNLLAVVLGSVDLACARIASGAPALEHLQHIRAAVVQARTLTDQLLAYSGRGKLMIKPVDLSELVKEMVDLLGFTLPKSVTFEHELAGGLRAIDADPSQLRQVVMNLVTNAAEAITGSSGVVSVRTRMLHVDRALLARADPRETLSEGDYVCLEVEDNGSGMSAELQSRIFDPFFTTKFAGRGLGLAAVLGIVRGHRGALLVDSSAGNGSLFRVLFPASERRADPIAAVRGADQWEELKSDALVLLVDDDSRVRKVLAELLRLLGLRVFEAANGEEACLRFEERKDEIALVLLDMTMPVLDGAQTLERLKRIKSDVKVVLLSGYTQDDVRSRLHGSEIVAFVHKPFHMNELVSVLKQALE